MPLIKENIANNIACLRKSAAMTQSELAERLNYSDKAVSKWERAESIPDITTLIELSELFGVTLDDLVRGEAIVPAPNSEAHAFRKSRVAITLLAILAVWFAAAAVFVLLSFFENVKGEWLAFVGAVPSMCIVWLVFNSIWFNRRFNYVIISFLVWTMIAAVHLTFLACGVNLWQLYLLGIPGQATILVWSKVKIKNKTDEQVEQEQRLPQN